MNVLRKRVLVVDDEESVRVVASHILNRNGYEAEAVGNGVEALETIKSTTNPFNLLLTDYNMPEINGLTLIQKVRELAPEMKAIMMTGSAEITVTPEIREKGVFGIISKPFNSKEFMLMVEKSFSRTGSRL